MSPAVPIRAHEHGSDRDGESPERSSLVHPHCSQAESLLLPSAVRFLVTGATGFVGGAIVRRLLAEGDAVHGLVRNRSAARALEAEGATLFEGTLDDPNAIAEAARGTEVVIHAAGLTSQVVSPRAHAWTHVAGTENVLNAARHVGCARLVHLSCADVTLGNEDRVHWNEDRALTGRPLGAHAQSKLLAEEIVLAASDATLETVALRPAMIWGPGDTTHLPRLCEEGVKGGIRLVGTGENLISTTYIDHLVDAVLAAAEATRAPGHAFYVTDGAYLDAREFFASLSSALELPRPRVGPPYALAFAGAWLREGWNASGHRRAHVARRGRSTLFDRQRTETILECSPHVPLAEGMQATATWVRSMGGPAAVAKLARAPIDEATVHAQFSRPG